MSHLEVALGDVGLKPVHEVLDLKFLAHPLGAGATGNLLRWDEHIADNLNDAVPCDAILDRDATESINLDADEATVAGNVNAEAAVLEQGRKVNVEVSLGHTFLALAIRAVKGIRVEGVVGDKVVLKQSLEVLLTVLAEEEGVDARAKLLESEVGRGEESAALVVGSVDHVEETSLAEAELEGGELARKKVNDGGDVGRRQDEGVHAVDDTVGTENVDGNNAGVEVDGQASEADVESKTLRLGLASEVFTLEQCGYSVGEQHTLGRIEVLDNVVGQEVLEEFFAGLVVVLRDLLESFVRRSKDGVVGLGAVELLDKIGVIIKKLGELGGVLAVGNQFVHSLVWWAVVRRVVRTIVRWVVRTIVRRVVRTIVRRTMVRVVESLIERLQLRLEPGLGIEGGVLDLVAEIISLRESGIESVLGLLGNVVPGILGSLGHFIIVLLEAGKDVILGGDSLIVQGVATTVVLLNGELLEDLLGGQDKGRACCHEWQDVGELHGWW
jgi:hypothetical protein